MGAFSVKAECPAGGWYKVQIKYVSAGKEEIKVIENVGVGEVIIGAGQSNSTKFFIMINIFNQHYIKKNRIKSN